MASLHFFRHLMFVTDLHDLSPIISITFFFSVVIVPSEDSLRRRVGAYTRSWGGCQEIFLTGGIFLPPVKKRGAFQAQTSSFVETCGLRVSTNDDVRSARLYIIRVAAGEAHFAPSRRSWEHQPCFSLENTSAQLC